MLINNMFNIQDIVYLKTDKNQEERVVVSIQINPGNLMYGVSFDGEVSWHYEFELTAEKTYQGYIPGVAEN